ncbi:MAG: hypothetical protein KAR17_11580 [Cyclobacteriaceae bacterium]|nr:hypothetical protein [Cyclobacteriaceae bacterium]MCK5281684.1 hypothetical protein [Cyclobacteriaceae bacterium]
MKKLRIKYIFAIALFLAYFSCRDESTLPYPDINEHVGAVTNVETNPDKSFFNALNDIAAEEVEFTVDVNGFNITQINSIDLELVFTQLGVLLDLEGNPRDSIWAPVLVANITSFPSTVTVTGQQAADALGVSVDDFEVGDSFQLTFPIHTADGRRLTVALNSDLCNEPVQPSFGGCKYVWGIACPSDLAGTFDYSTIVTAVGAGGDIGGCSNPVTGSGSLTEIGGGIYSLSDASFGQYDCAWADSPATGVTMTDICNAVYIGGSDQYGIIYTFVLLDNDGTNLTIDWSNDYADAGTSILTRNDGKSWPLDMTIQ